MSKFNRPTARPAARGPMTTEAVPTLRTHEGAPGHAKDEKTELFQLAVTNMVGERAFYESAQDRDGRFRSLVRAVAVADPAWVLGMVGWLRGEANMRTASIVMAAEAVKARLDRKVPSDISAEQQGVNRKLIAAALQRADEPGELLAYWTSTHGRAIPKPVKRGVADAVQRLYTEYNLLKWDTASHGFRFGDVVDLVHPDAGTPDQGALYRYALDRRHGRDLDTFGPLTMVQANAQLRADAQVFPYRLLDADRLKAAGMTWEDALSLAGNKVSKAKLWEALIPSMGYMALLRNLRNFDEAGVSDQASMRVIARLTDPVQVLKSRQLPFRFFSAYLAAPSDRWKHALALALDTATANVPVLSGRTLVLIDTSGSMTGDTVSANSKVTPAQAAAVLGFVLAKRSGADVVQWASTHAQFPLRKGASALSEIERFLSQQGRCGHGTDLRNALGAYAKHDRVFILSDFQTATYASEHLIPPHVPVYAFDLRGYRAAAFSTVGTRRYQLGGYSDSVFKMVPLLERNRDAGWPWKTGD